MGCKNSKVHPMPVTSPGAGVLVVEMISEEPKEEPKQKEEEPEKPKFGLARFTNFLKKKKEPEYPQVDIVVGYKVPKGKICIDPYDDDETGYNVYTKNVTVGYSPAIRRVMKFFGKKC